MKAQTRYTFIGLLVLIALVASIALPITAFADEAPTPPPSSDTSGSAQPAQGDDASAPAQPATRADTSAPANPAPADDSSAPAQPADTSAPTDPAPAVDTSAPAQAADAPAATQDPATAVVTDTPAPADTTTDTNSPAATDTPVVVLNSDGTVEPLATQAAADIIATGDPMWCPSGVTPGGSGCTSSDPSVSSSVTTLLAAIIAANTATANTYSGPGTVYFTSNYNTNDATFNQSSDSHLASLTTLTIQGGWNGSTGAAFSLSGVTTFSVPLTVINWTDDVTIKDITISAGSLAGDGLDVATTGNIKVHNVNSSDNNKGEGADLDNRAGTGDINVDNSTFNNNHYYGLVAQSNGTITLTNTIANGNGGDGAYLYNFDGFGFGDISVSDSTFGTSPVGETWNGNGNNGLVVYSNGNVTLTNVTADYNKYDGALVGSILDGEAYYEVGGAITVTGGDFSNNGNRIHSPNPAGLEAYADGSITLSGVTANGNAYDGAYLDNCIYTESDGCIGTGSIMVNGSSNTFNGNGSDGLDAYSNGKITLADVTANSNTDGAGVDAEANGDITLNNVSANNNLGGAFLFAGLFLDPDINITNSQFNNNGLFGLQAIADGNITLTNTEASGNDVFGAFLVAISADGAVSVNCGEYNGNGVAGIFDPQSASLNLNSVELSGNGNAPYLYEGTAVIGSIDCSGSSGGHHRPAGAYLPIHTINVTGGEDNPLDCTQYGGTQLILPDNDSALFPCPISDSASIGSLTNDKLPGSLPVGDTFVSGFTISVIKNGASHSPVESPINVSFTVPDNMKNDKLAILYWDGSKWVEVSGHMTADGHFETTTDLTGTFVLVSK